MQQQLSPNQQRGNTTPFSPQPNQSECMQLKSVCPFNKFVSFKISNKFHSTLMVARDNSRHSNSNLISNCWATSSRQTTRIIAATRHSCRLDNRHLIKLKTRPQIGINRIQLTTSDRTSSKRIQCWMLNYRYDGEPKAFCNNLMIFKTSHMLSYFSSSNNNKTPLQTNNDNSNSSTSNVSDPWTRRVEQMSLGRIVSAVRIVFLNRRVHRRSSSSPTFLTSSKWG